MPRRPFKSLNRDLHALADQAGEQASAATRAHPVAADTLVSVAASAIVALLATFALVRLSQF